MNRISVVLLCGGLLGSIAGAAEVLYPAVNEEPADAPVGQRPYEMDWAGRFEPEHPQLADFEDLTGWQVRCFDGAKAALFRSRQKLLYGDYTARIEYHGESYASRLIIEPPEPIVIPNAFTGVNLWMHGNAWAFERNLRNAIVGVNVLVRDAAGRDFSVPMDPNSADYWFLSHRTCVSPDGATVMYTAVDGAGERIQHPATFTGIEVTGISNKKTEWLHFDALQFYVMEYPPLEVEPIPDSLPWPTTEDTILPTLKTPAAMNMHLAESQCEWQVTGDETLVFRYTPETGTLGDIRVQAGGQEFMPCLGGGIHFQFGNDLARADSEGATATLLSFDVAGRGCKASWQVVYREYRAEYAYELSVKGKSLVIDVTTEGASATRLDIGGVKGMLEPKTVYFPYLTYGNDWPKVVASQGSEGPVFLWAACDYYNSEASELFGTPSGGNKDATPYTGGALYKPTTDGMRNPLRERIFVNVSRDVQEVLPNIPNPDSEMAQLSREYLWQNIGHAHQREQLSKFKAYGIDKFIACHHEVGWREGGESFTLRDRPADSIGAEALAEYGAFVRGLGYRFGTYTNYVDYAPVNVNWNEDFVNLNPDGTWQRAWPRCYALKPLRAAELEAKYAPLIHARYGANAQYCDVHTAYTPWGRTDYDARTPGAGKFRTQFDAFARLLYNESYAYGGPVFSEGNYHWFYAGIVDGNYATIMPYGEGWKVEPLVDFDLLKMHTKMTDFGMGFGEMFYGYQGEWQRDQHRLNPWFDRFTASTIAFGHIGFLTYEWGFEATLKGYYQLQALQKRYALVPVRSIRYHDGEALLDTSAAILSDAYRRRHLFVEYESGLQVWVNLNATEDWTVELNESTYLLPSTGFLAYKPDDILAYSAIVDGQRHELVQCGDYLYLDSRDAFVRTDTIAANGSVAVKPDEEGAWWIIPATRAEEVSINRDWLGTGAEALFEAQAYDEAGHALTPAEVRHGDGWITIMPVTHPEVIKYRLQKRGDVRSAWYAPDMPKSLLPGAHIAFTLEQLSDAMAPGSSVEITLFGTDGSPAVPVSFPWEIKDGKALARIDAQLPKDLSPGKRCWFRCATPGDEHPLWLDASVLPPLSVILLSDGTVSRRDQPLGIQTTLTSNLPDVEDLVATLSVGDKEPLKQKVTIEPGQTVMLHWETEQPDTPLAQALTLSVAWTDDRIEVKRFLKTEPDEYVIADLSQTSYTAGQCRRGEPEMPYDFAGTNAFVTPTRETLNEVTLDSLHTHPPWGDKTGYVFVVWPLDLPEEPARLEFALGFKTGSSTLDGCVFTVAVIHDGQETALFSEQYQTLGAWAQHTVDLSLYAGESVQLKLITDAGAADSSHSDWALWGAPRVVAAVPMMRQHLLDEALPESYESPHGACPGLTESDLQNIASAHLAMETAGVDGGPYASHVYFNGVRIGETPPSGGDVVWKPGVIPLTPAALETLGPMNTVVIRNPNHDFMKVRRLCLHLKLNDERACSSYVALGPWCSASGWAHEEGMSVAVGHDLHPIRLDVPMP